jgi:MFS family permease
MHKESEINRLKSQHDDISLKEAICTKQFWTFFIMSICFGFCYMAIIVHLAPHMTDLGISSFVAANSMATIGGASVVSVVSMGIIGDKFGNKKMLIIGFVLMFSAMFSLLFIRESAYFYIFAVVFSFAFGCIQIQRSPLVATMFGVKSHGLIFGIIDNSFTIGAAIGPVVYGHIYDTSDSYRIAFLISSLLCLLGLILMVLLKPQIASQTLNRTKWEM